MSAVELRRIDHITLRVRSLDDSAEFYQRVLDAEPEPAVLRGRAAVILRNRDVRIELVPGRPVTPVSTVDHFSLEVVDPDDVEQVRRRARAAGARVTEQRERDGRRRIFLFDPDGNKVEIVEPLRGER